MSVNELKEFRSRGYKPFCSTPLLLSTLGIAVTSSGIPIPLLISCQKSSTNFCSRLFQASFRATLTTDITPFTMTRKTFVPQVSAVKKNFIENVSHIRVKSYLFPSVNRNKYIFLMHSFCWSVWPLWSIWKYSCHSDHSLFFHSTV